MLHIVRGRQNVWRYINAIDQNANRQLMISVWRNGTFCSSKCRLQTSSEALDDVCSPFDLCPAALIAGSNNYSSVRGCDDVGGGEEKGRVLVTAYLLTPTTGPLHA